jgi:uncharacterized damage-inducible protein DinB
MLPPRVLSTFQNAPTELVDVCRPHSWDELTAVPGAGMKSIRDILVHLIDADAGWIGHAMEGGPREPLGPDMFQGLDEILTTWEPRRIATVRLLQRLPPEERTATRRDPWNPAVLATVEEIVWHVVTHEQYHRGQIFARLALVGRRDLPDLDVIRG